MDCSPPGSCVHGDSPGKNSGVGCHALLQGISRSRDWTRVSCISCKADSLPAKSWGKPIAIKDFCKANTYVFQK